MLDFSRLLFYNNLCSNEYALLAQLDRAFGYGPKGQEFESLTARQKKEGPPKRVVFSFILLVRENSCKEFVDAAKKPRKAFLSAKVSSKAKIFGNARSVRKFADGEYLLQRAKKKTIFGWSFFIHCESNGISSPQVYIITL